MKPYLLANLIFHLRHTLSLLLQFYFFLASLSAVNRLVQIISFYGRRAPLRQVQEVPVRCESECSKKQDSFLRNVPEKLII
jgi:hypothetical protein